MSKILTCEHLTKAYGKEKTALNGIDLNLDFGRIVGLLGPNGSGKTTLLKLANGLLQPTEGVVKIAGMTPGPETKEIVSYLPDADWLPDWMRVEELVNMFQDFYGTPCEAKAYIGFDAAKANEMLARLNIDPKARLKTLSKGTKEKVQLVLAMSRAAKLYLLDEPIGGVDPAARDYILNTIISNYSKDADVLDHPHQSGPAGRPHPLRLRRLHDRPSVPEACSGDCLYRPERCGEPDRQAAGHEPREPVHGHYLSGGRCERDRCDLWNDPDADHDHSVRGRLRLPVLLCCDLGLRGGLLLPDPLADEA